MYACADPVLHFLLEGLREQQLATVAANSLQSICAQCRDQMTNHFTGLMSIVEHIDTFSVSNDAVIGVLKGKQRDVIDFDIVSCKLSH